VGVYLWQEIAVTTFVIGLKVLEMMSLMKEKKLPKKIKDLFQILQ